MMSSLSARWPEILWHAALLFSESTNRSETMRSIYWERSGPTSKQGHSLEATARELFVHPNTVRYRLKKVVEVVEWDPGEPRDALTLHLALILGSMSEPNQGPATPGTRKL